jgi:hypothetical protein
MQLGSQVKLLNVFFLQNYRGPDIYGATNERTDASQEKMLHSKNNSNFQD